MRMEIASAKCALALPFSRPRFFIIVGSVKFFNSGSRKLMLPADSSISIENLIAFSFGGDVLPALNRLSPSYGLTVPPKRDPVPAVLPPTTKVPVDLVSVVPFNANDPALKVTPAPKLILPVVTVAAVV